MDIKGLKRRMLFGNIIFLLSFFCSYGGGFLDNYGFILLASYIIYMSIVFPNETSSVFLNRYMLPLYCFTFIFMLSSGFYIKAVLSFFFKLVIIPIAYLHLKLLKKYPVLISVQNWMVIIILILICYFCIQALVFLEANPLAMRELISTNKDESIIVGGGFGLPYSLCLFLPTLILIIRRNGVISFYSIFLILFSILGVAVIILSQYMTAFLLLFTGYFFTFTNKYDGIIRTMIIIAGVFLFFNLYMFLPNLFESLGFEELEMLSNRLDEVIHLASGNLQDASDFSFRVDLSLLSLETFSENILFGIGHKYGYSYGRMYDNGVGMHAEWFDLLAINGLFSILIFWFLIKWSSKLQIKKNISTLIFFILGFFNPVMFFQILFVVYYLIPISSFIYLKNNNYETKRNRIPY